MDRAAEINNGGQLNRRADQHTNDQTGDQTNEHGKGAIAMTANHRSNDASNNASNENANETAISDTHKRGPAVGPRAIEGVRYRAGRTIVRRRAYPVAMPADGADDLRFCVGLVLGVARVIERHGYPPMTAVDVADLGVSLFRLLYGESVNGIDRRAELELAGTESVPEAGTSLPPIPGVGP